MKGLKEPKIITRSKYKAIVKLSSPQKESLKCNNKEKIKAK